MLDPFVTLGVSLADRGPGEVVPLPSDEHGHLRKVLRLGDGAPLEVADGAGWSATGELVGDDVRLTSVARFEPRPRPALVVIHALPKGRKLDEVVRLLTELGVDRIVPAETDHSVVRLRGDKGVRAAERWRSVASAAGNQSRRAWRCEVDLPRPLDAALDALAPLGGGLVAQVGAERSVGQGLEVLGADPGAVVLAVGPEGGWSEEEVEMLTGRALVPVTLGPTVLRTEHAASVLTAIAGYILGRLD